MTTDGITNRDRVANVGFDEGQATGRLPVSGDEAVEDHHLVARLPQRLGSVTADIPGAAGDEDRAQGYLPIEKYVKPWARICSVLNRFRPSKMTGSRISDRMREKSGSRNSFHSVTITSASAPLSAS